MKRKAFSVLMVLCILLSMLPMTAFADNSVVTPQKDFCVTAASDPGAYNSVQVDIGNENYHTDRGRVEINGGITGYYYEGEVITASGGLMQTFTDSFQTLMSNVSDFFHSLDDNP